MSRIACEVEGRIEFESRALPDHSEALALSAAAESIGKFVQLRGIAVLTTSGHTARAVAATRTKIPIAALTTDPSVYHWLNLLWGIHPILVSAPPATFEGLVEQTEAVLRERKVVDSGDRVLIIGGIPPGQPRGGNFIKIHTIS